MHIKQHDLEAWAMDFPGALAMLNAFNGVETVAIILLHHSQLLAHALASAGWRENKSEEKQIRAIVDAELARRAIEKMLK